MHIKNTLLAASLFALTACSSSGSTSDLGSIADPTTSSTAVAVADPTTSSTAVAVSAEMIIAAMTATLKGPISIVVTDGSERVELSETVDGNRLLRVYKSDVTTEVLVVGDTVYSTAPEETSFAGRWYAMDPSDGPTDILLTHGAASFTSPLRDLFQDALNSVFGYDLDDCLENDPTPELLGGVWSVTCTDGVDLEVTLDGAGRLANLDLGDGYVAKITYEALDVKVPTDLILGDELVEFAAEIKKFTGIATVESVLTDLSRMADAIIASTAPGASLNDTQVTDAVIQDAGRLDSYGATVARKGASRIRVDISGPGFSCGGTLDIRSGTVTVGKVTCS